MLMTVAAAAVVAAAVADAAGCILHCGRGRAAAGLRTLAAAAATTSAATAACASYVRPVTSARPRCRPRRSSWSPDESTIHLSPLNPLEQHHFLPPLTHSPLLLLLSKKSHVVLRGLAVAFSGPSFPILPISSLACRIKSRGREQPATVVIPVSAPPAEDRSVNRGLRPSFVPRERATETSSTWGAAGEGDFDAAAGISSARSLVRCRR